MRLNRCTLLLLALVLIPACGKQDASEERGPVSETHPETETPYFMVNGLYNSGFEWIADSTTTPPKYGAYWVGAFANKEGDSWDLIEEESPYRGKRYLRLVPDGQGVLQKVVADPRLTDRTEIILAVRLEGAASLEVTLEDGPGHTVKAIFVGTPGTSGTEITARWEKRSESAEDIRLVKTDESTGGSWALARLPVGSRFCKKRGFLPVPRLNVRLECKGPKGAWADVDEVVASVAWPRVNAADLERRSIEKVTNCLETWLLPGDQGGLGLVDPSTGYILVRSCNIETGQDQKPFTSGGLHTLYDLVVRWLRYTRERGWNEEVERWTPHLERYVRTLLDHNFNPDTHLPGSVNLNGLALQQQKPVTTGAYVEFLLEAREVIRDAGLKEKCILQARRTADTLLALQRAHDLPKAQHPNTIRYNRGKGRFEGEWPNWFGHIPHRLTPGGTIEQPARFNTAWAILSGRTFWYHLFKSASAIMAVHATRPADGDLSGIQRGLSLYHRDWDAARYDLENDTDDHYGYLCEDLIPLLKNSGGRLSQALRLVQDATDHRLPRDGTGLDDTLWIQAVRLGTACAGDSPRALKGLLDFYELPSDINTESAGNPIYREALLELAGNDLKGRQLTNGQFTESFFKNWEMVCICFRGAYQGDCREHPPEFWHGDVGDIFGGPPTSAIKAQIFAYRAAAPGERQTILSALGLIEHVTEATMARRYGYVYGLNPAVARQYELPDKYITGESLNNAVALAYAVTWMKLLPYLDAQPVPIIPRISPVDPQNWPNDPGGFLVKIDVQGPPGGLVALPLHESAALPCPAPVSSRDGRMAAFPLPEGWMSDPVRLDRDGRAVQEIRIHASRHAVVQPVLLDPQGGVPLALGPACVLRQ